MVFHYSYKENNLMKKFLTWQHPSLSKVGHNLFCLQKIRFFVEARAIDFSFCTEEKKIMQQRVTVMLLVICVAISVQTLRT